MNKKYINYASETTLTHFFKEVKKVSSDFKSKHNNLEYLTQDEEIKLAKRIKNGDRKAVDELVKANLKFVIKIAKPYQGHGLSLGDLISEGSIGLIKAANKFDHTKGYRFISYAVWWIKQSIIFSLNENARTVRLPTSMLNKLNGLKKIIDKFEIENGREPLPEEINENTNEIISLLKNTKCLSLNESVNEDGDELINLLSNKVNDNNDDDDDKFIVSEKLKNEINKTLDLLSEREREIIKCYYGIDSDCQPMTLDTIGERLGLTKERVRQIKMKTLKKLRFHSENIYKVMNE